LLLLAKGDVRSSPGTPSAALEPIRITSRIQPPE
jgi:hypothetical protein